MDEKEIKQSINSHLRKYSVENDMGMPDVNREAKRITGKPRAEMTFDELEIFNDKIESHFPLS